MAHTADHDAPVANGHRWPCPGFFDLNHSPLRKGVWSCSCAGFVRDSTLPCGCRISQIGDDYRHPLTCGTQPIPPEVSAQEKPRRRVIGSDGASRPERGQP